MFLPLRLSRRVLLGILALFAAISLFPSAQQLRSSADPAVFHGCTSIMVGRLATSDGSVITSHTADGRYRTWLNIVPHRSNPPGATSKIYVGRMHTRYPEDERGLKVTGEIPEPPETYAFINTA